MTENKYLRWLDNSTQSIYWHDSAIRSEQLDAFENGAAGMTTNPFLINATLNRDRNFWKEQLAIRPKNLEGDAKAEDLIRCVTGYYSDQLMPIFEKGEAGKGYVCAQTNPNHTGDEGFILEQAKAISRWAPNIVVKVPATSSGIKAYEECIALGINVAATISFTVPQVLAVGEAAARGMKRAKDAGIEPGLSVAVLMVGRLDDYLRDVADDSCPEVKESDIVQAGTACIKRAYDIFNERGYDTYLMPAGCRGTYHITELAGAKMIMSIAPKIASMLLEEQRMEERIHVPVARDVINRLMKMGEFRKAYEPDGMTLEEFITFGSTNRTTDQFINGGWNPLTTYDF